MRIAVVHYHLRPGGVTRVIASARDALRDSAFHLATVAGSEGADAVVPELDYSTEPTDTDARALATRLENAARAALGAPPDIWHIHNHGLGRHPSATAAFTELAARGQRVLFHIHDFAEDGRPQNYRLLRERLGSDLSGVLYPAAPHIHYAVLNPRDRHALEHAGIPPTHLHTLPNPVVLDPVAGEPSSSVSRDLVLYPTRAIRRKNIGEFLLWAALESEGRTFALTLAPTSPMDVAPYKHWKSFAQEHALPVAFEVGLRPDATLSSLFARSSLVVTTSIAEGFGLTFAEPWLAGCPLAGRALPAITADLEADGLRLDSLYERLDVPLSWIGAPRLQQRIDRALRSIAADYNVRLPEDAPQRAFDSMVRDGCVDVGRMDEPMQQVVIEHILRDPTAIQGIHPAQLRSPSARDWRKENGAAVARSCSLARYAERVCAIYGALAASSPGPLSAYNAEAVLRFFLDPARLFLLRSP